MLVLDNLSKSNWTIPNLNLLKNSLIHHVHSVLSNIPVSETRLKQFQLEAKNDPILQTWLLTQSMNGQKSFSYPQIYIYPPHW